MSQADQDPHRRSAAASVVDDLTHVAGEDPLRRTLNRGVAACIAVMVVLSVASLATHVLSARWSVVILIVVLLPFYGLAWALNRRGGVSGIALFAGVLVFASTYALFRQDVPVTSLVAPANLVIPVALTAIFIGPRAGLATLAAEVLLLVALLLTHGYPLRDAATWLTRVGPTLVAATAIACVGSALLWSALRRSIETARQLEGEVRERRAAEAILRASEERYRTVVESLPNGAVVIYDRELKIRFAAGVMMRQTGRTPASVLGRAAADFVPPEDGPQIVAHLQRAAAGETVTFRSRNPSGLQFLTTAAPLSTQVGTAEAVISVSVDVTDQVKAEEKVRETSLSLREAYRLGKLGTWDYDPSTQQLEWSDELFTFYDRDPAAGVPTAAEVRGLYSVEELARIDAMLEAVMATGERQEIELTVCLPSGVTKHLHAIVTAVKNREGRIVRLRGIAQDVTERRVAEDAVRQSHRQLRAFAARLDAVREEESKRIARELHDVLGQQLTAAGMELTNLEEGAAEGDPDIRSRSARLRALMDGMVAAVQKLSSELRFGHVDLLGLSSAIAWQLKDFEKRSRIRTILDEPARLPHLAEPVAVALFRILQEALTNVARHANAREVVVKLQQRGDVLAMEIRDNGRGISPEQIREPRSLGLVGMRERAEAAGGRFAISGQAGAGTTISACFPCGGTSS